MDQDDAAEAARRQAAWRESIEETLAKCDRALEAATEARAEREQRGEAGWRSASSGPSPSPRPAPPDAASVDPPLRRPANVPRDWIGEQRWIEQIVDQRFTNYLSGAIGQALGQIARGIDADIAELRRQIKKLKKARTDDNQGLQASLVRMNELLTRIDETGRRLRRLDGDEPEPPPGTLTTH